ncbi:MAG: signal peptide peptidase SppA [Candidatus Fermentibacter sp.]|nr:signal peptide peptidase SppA [Candidatus Fermentibacter sp.]
MMVMTVAVALIAGLPGPADVFDWPAFPGPGMVETVNPACLAWQPDMLLSVGLPSSDSSLHRPDRVFLGAPGVGFSGWWENGGDLRRFTAGSAFGIGGSLAAGAAYSWMDPVSGGPWDGVGSWDIGLSFRPSAMISAGLVRHGGYDGGSVEGDASLRAGLAVRPLGDRLTFTGNAVTGEDFDDFEFDGGLEYRPVPGAAIRLGLAEDRVSAGISTDFGHLGAAFAGLAQDDEYSGGRAEIRLTSSPRAGILPRRHTYVRIETGTTREEPSRAFLGPVGRSFSEEILLVERAVEDPSVDGFIVETDGGTGTAAQAEELRTQLARARGMGKQVVVYSGSPGNIECYLGSSGTEFWMHPAGETFLTGFAAHGIFIRDLLDNIGLYPDLVRIGEYKSAADMLTRSDMSEAQRIAETALLESFHTELFRALTDGRGLEPPQMVSLLEEGMLNPREAVSAGLVDSTAYPDEIQERLSETNGHGIAVQSLDEYGNSIPVGDAWGPEPRIAVIVATGFITRGSSGYSFPLGETMGSETICGLVRSAAARPGVKAVVIRIDSGGGDSFASEEMLHCIEDVSDEMPVVVSMGGVAASGGYYMACGADSIFADDFTITGSIGVIGGKIAAGDLLDRIGVDVETVSPYPMADMFSIFSRFSDAQRENVEESVGHCYDLFTQRVAEGRGMTPAQVDSIGRGRVWSGSDAVEIGLVDRIGGLADAVRCAAGMAGLDDDWVPAVEVYPRPGLFEGFSMSPFGGASLLDLESLLEQVSAFDRPLYLMQPIVVE